MGIISILWVIVGFSLAFGKDANGSGILGYPKTFYMYNDVGANPDPMLCGTIPLTAFSMFQLMFAIITAALISGSLAERVNFNSWMLFVCFWHILVYCPIAHMSFHPNGVFRRWGLLDFAGGTVVEMASGYSALAGAMFLGPRTNVHLGTLLVRLDGL
jgi:ammonium transporter, Amt family